MRFVDEIRATEQAANDPLTGGRQAD
jgi:hypothetical protein